MYISPLEQALCEDRTKITIGPEPAGWFTPSLPEGWRLLTFHFFVDWRQTPPVVADRIWMSRQLQLDAFDTLDKIKDDEILSLFVEGSTRLDFEYLVRACEPYGHQVSAILLPEIPFAAISDDTPVWVIARSIELEMRIYRPDIRDLRRVIQDHSGGPVHVGSKGLTYGTSAVECYLSVTDAAFPGDADSVMVDDQNRIRCIIEHKKHTLQAPIGEHLVTRYYPRPDGRKYQRLDALAARYRNLTSRHVPLVVLYYSTRIPVIRLQELGALDTNSIQVNRDSGDIRINGRTLEDISEEVVAWLGMNR